MRHATLLATLAAAAILAPALQAQELSMPRAVKRAYTTGTRSFDGNPGSKYWQNHGRYRITISTTPPNPKVSGTEEITYTNESPDTLRSLVIRLFPNAHRPGAPRFGGAPEDALTSGVHITSYAVNGATEPWHDSPRFFTWQPVRLSTPLAPHQSVQLSFAWWYDLPARAGREGVIDSTTFYVAYSYPRVAVYDDYNGWDTMDHAGHEFYNDFNDYDVTVQVPANYVVWGTGTLTNAPAVLQPAALGRFEASLASDTIIHVASGTDIRAGSVTTPGPGNAWHFTASDVPDVAFGLSDHYDWDAAGVLVDNSTGRRASVQAAYNDTAADFHQMVKFVAHSLDFLSHQWPGVPYPYEKMTAFQGGAGMEYPMMANDESYPDPAFAQFVVAHEIAHTYMPFYMGVNETRYAFMDEGWATTFEYLINTADMGAEKATSLFKQFRIANWARNPSPPPDVPVITPADELAGSAYGINAYGKPALAYLALKDMLGDAMFRKALHAYMARWHGKHPTPWDFFYTFNNATGRSLDWFWRGWFFSDGYVDLAVKSVVLVKGGYTAKVDNIGGMPAPFDLDVTLSNGTTKHLHQTAAVWAANGHTATITVPVSGTLRSMKLDGGIWMDADTTNNSWTRH